MSREGGSAIGHLPSLDGVRGIAIGTVMLMHFTYSAGGEPRGLVERVPIALLRLGWMGVDLFFVLSGFLITSILIQTKTSESYFRTFYGRRVLRIFPLYYAVLAGVALLTLLYPTADPAQSGVQAFRDHQAWLWLYGQNVLMTMTNDWVFAGTHVHLAHFWSLAVEEHFYMVWPAVIYFGSPRASLRVALAVFVGALAARMFVWDAYGPMGAYVLTPCRADSLTIGAALALLRTEGGLSRRAMRALSVGAGIGAVGLLSIVAKEHRIVRADHLTTVLCPTFAALIFVWFIARALESDRDSLLSRILGSRLLTTLGRYSYGLYVYHSILVPCLDRWLPTDLFRAFVPIPLMPSLLRMAICSCIAFAAAYASWHLFEDRFIALKRLLPYARPASTPSRAQRT